MAQKISELRQIIRELSSKIEDLRQENLHYKEDRIRLLEENSRLKDQVINALTVKTSYDVPKQQGNLYKVKLTSFGGFKIHCIKTIRNYTNISLKDAKNLVEAAPCFIFQGNKETVERFNQDLLDHRIIEGYESVKCYISS